MNPPKLPKITPRRKVFELSEALGVVLVFSLSINIRKGFSTFSQVSRPIPVQL